MKKIIECIPNFSEGRNPEIIQAIVDAINSVKNVVVLHVDMGYDANRTVITFAGDSEQILEASFLAIQKATELIDMTQQTGEHPRMGATDVFPMVPIQGISMQETIQLSEKLAQKVANKLKIQVYLYEKSAKKIHRQSLADCRKGEYENMSLKVKEPGWIPDYGPNQFNAKSGVTVIGARNFLIAYNINLNSTNKNVAKKIAEQLRESGFLNENKQRIKGLLKSVRAIGWYMEAYNKAQVSTNLVNFRKTPIHIVYETAKELASKEGFQISGSELIGLVPKQAIIDAGKYYASKKHKFDMNSESDLINCAIQNLGLDELAPFNQNNRILENVIQAKLSNKY